MIWKPAVAMSTIARPGRHGFVRASVFMVTAILAITAWAAATPEAPSYMIKNIVLVHGAAVDGSGWREVYNILRADGYHVTVVQPPLTSLAQDVAATKRVLDRQDGPVVLVGHSYGGPVITVAGTDPKARVLVDVAALQPDVGETTAALAASKPGRMPPWPAIYSA